MPNSMVKPFLRGGGGGNGGGQGRLHHKFTNESDETNINVFTLLINKGRTKCNRFGEPGVGKSEWTEV